MLIFKLIFTLAIMFSSLFLNAEVHEVVVSSNVFTPASLSIEAGDTVRWTNTGGGHNVFANDFTYQCAEGCAASGGNGSPSSNLWVAEVVFRQVEFSSYICQPHVGFGMTGSVNVIEPQSVLVHEVHATAGNLFVPNTLTIEKGEVVKFINDGGEHNIHAIDGSFTCSQSCEGDGKNLAFSPNPTPWNLYKKFETAEEIDYICETHNNIGHITVKEGLLFKDGFE